MSAYYTRRSTSNQKAFSLSQLSSGDEMQTISRHNRHSRRQLRGRRRSLKLRNSSVPRRHIQITNQSDASVEDGIVHDDDDTGVLGSSEESDNNDRAPSGISPACSIRKSAFQPLRVDRLSSKIRQAGRYLSKSLSPRDNNKLRSILSHGRRQSTDKVRFNPQVEQRSPSPFVYEDEENHSQEMSCQQIVEDFANLSEDNAIIDENDESCYETLEDLSDSDVDDADESTLEDLETKYLINHLIKNDELPTEEGVFSEHYYMTQFARPDLTEVSHTELILPSTEIWDGEAIADDDALSNRPPSTYEEMIELLSRPPSPSLGDPFASKIPSDTGLETPSSLSQNYCSTLNYDAEDTEPEEPKVASVSAARLKRISGHGLSVSTESTAVRKSSKPKTPKRGNFRTKRNSVVIQHNDEGELVISKAGSSIASGTITPRGTLTADSKSKKPLDKIRPIPLASGFMGPVTAPSSVISSPVMSSTYLPDSPLRALESSLFSSTFSCFSETPGYSQLCFHDFIAVKDD